MNFCARCRRPLRRDPIVIDGRGYGPACAGLLDYLFAPARSAPIVSRVRARHTDPRQPNLFEAQP